MVRGLFVVPVLLVLSACGDPLAGIEKIGDVQLAETDAATAAALAAEDEVAREGFFGQAQPAPTGAETAVAEDVASAAETKAAPKRGGLFGLFDRMTESASDASTETETATAEKAVPADVVADQTADAADPAPVARRGLFGLRSQPDTEAKETGVRTASLTPVETPASGEGALASVEKRTSLFGRKAAPRTGPDAADVTYGTRLPYGQIARVCEARRKPMGRKIGKSASGGKAFTLFDSDPGSTAPRTFYITGFSDSCPRQFTAALALFGAPSFHEQLRYGRAAKAFPYSETDKAYEKVKSRICRVGKNKPCGSQIQKLEKSTTFVTTYEQFGGASRWADMLLHDGEVLAASLKAKR